MTFPKCVDENCVFEFRGSSDAKQVYMTPLHYSINGKEYTNRDEAFVGVCRCVIHRKYWIYYNYMPYDNPIFFCMDPVDAE